MNVSIPIIFFSLAGGKPSIYLIITCCISTIVILLFKFQKPDYEKNTEFYKNVENSISDEKKLNKKEKSDTNQKDQKEINN